MTESERLFEQALTLMPGGVSSPVRSFGAVGGTPPFIERGAGCEIWDADGNRYVDYVMSWGALINGHAFPPVIKAIQEAAASGTSFGAPTRREVELAELIVDAIGSVDEVRFVGTGTEASMTAIRLARAYTERPLIVKFAGNYHGHSDMLLAEAGSGALTLGIPSSPGVPPPVAASTIVIPYNDSEELERIVAQHRTEIAALILEPIAANMGVVAASIEFLQGAEGLARDVGALFICDEVITGFRVALGGGQALFRLEPDLTILGKIIGGGLPAAAYGGRAELLEMIAPAGPVYQAGTLSGNPLAMAAGIANLRPLEDAAVYETLTERTNQLASGLRKAAEAAGVPATVNTATGMLTLFFTEGPVTTAADSQKSDVSRYAAFFHRMLERGIYLPPSQFEAWMLSTQHTESTIEQTIEAAADSLASLT